MSVPHSDHWFKRSFLEPFSSKKRVASYLASFLGTFGFTGIMTYFSYDFAQLGTILLLVYFIVRFSLAGFVCMPLALYSLHCLSIKRAYSIMLSAQFIAILYLILFPEQIFGQDLKSVLTVSILFAVMSAPFWSGFHLNMLTHTSDENMGNEVSISSIVLFFGGTASVIFTGFALAFFPGLGVAVFYFLCLIVASFLQMLIAIDKKIRSTGRTVFPLWQIIKKRKMVIWATAQEGAFQFLTSFSAPIWMWVIGIKSVAMGFLLSLQGIMKFFSSPLAGHLFHENKSRDLLVGAAIKPLGWLPWIFIQAPWVMLLSSFAWTLGQHLFSTGLASRWYAERSLAAQAVREMALSGGRMLCAVITIPVLFEVGVQAFFIAAFVLTLLTGAMALFMKRHEQKRK